MSTSSPVRASVMEEYGSDDDDLRRAIAESLLLSASPAIPLGFLGVNEVDESSRLHYESRSESSSSTGHHVGDAGEDDISLHQSTISMTSVEESEESSENFFAERLLASEDFMKKVKVCDENARTSFENFNSESFDIEATENSWPTQGSKVLSQALVRIGELQEMKQTLQESNPALTPAFHARIKAAEDEEVQCIDEILIGAGSGEEQQKMLSEIDERCQQTILALRQQCNKECMESLKAARLEKRRLFQQWSSSRQARLCSWERTARNTKEMQLELMPAIINALQKRGQAQRTNTDTETAINATQSSCCVCMEEIEGTGPCRSSGGDIKKRGCFYPCMHATTCLDCAIHIWDGSRTCPNCRGTLTSKPSALHL